MMVVYTAPLRRSAVRRRRRIPTHFEVSAMTAIQYYSSPLGMLLLAADEEGLTGVWFEGQKHFARTLPAEHTQAETPVLADTKRWLDVYFSGRAPDFLPPLHPAGCAFRQPVRRRNAKQNQTLCTASQKVRAGRKGT